MTAALDLCADSLEGLSVGDALGAQFFVPGTSVAALLFGRRPVKQSSIEYLRSGNTVEQAGAARAWYWTGVRVSFVPGTRTPTPESHAELESVADLRAEWQESALRVFLSEDDLDVRRCLLPGLDLRIAEAPAHLRDEVSEAIRIARGHPDEYLRHRVEHQI